MIRLFADGRGTYGYLLLMPALLAFSACSGDSTPAAPTPPPATGLAAPLPVSPNDGASTSSQPTLTVANVVRSGVVGAITYRFELATNPGFTPVAATGTVNEGTTNTSFTPSPALALGTKFYWRVTASQTGGATSDASATRAFSTGVTIDLNTVIYSYPDSPDVSSWRQTGTIIAVEQDGNPASGGPMCISFSTNEEWPTIPFFGDPDVLVYANQWYFANIGGQWYAGAGEYLRYERGFCKIGQETNAIGPDGGWLSPMRNWAPKPGELVGYMMTTPARAGMRSNDQRSNIVVQPWVDSSLGGASVRR